MKRVPGRIICMPIDDERGRGHTFLARRELQQAVRRCQAVNDGRGGQAIQLSLAPLLRFTIQGIAVVG